MFSDSLGDRCGERRLAVVDVADRANVDMRLGTLELLLCLVSSSLEGLRFSLKRKQKK